MVDVPTKEERLRKRGRALELRLQGLRYSEIADELGYADSTYVRKLIEHEIQRIQVPLADELRKQSLLRLQLLARAAWKVLRTPHVVVQQGRVVSIQRRDPETGEMVNMPLPDDGPVLAAIDRLLKIEDQVCRLLNLYAPKESKITLIEQDHLNQQIEELIERMGANDPQLAEIEASMPAE